MRCANCPNKMKTVPHRGNIDAEIVIVGESPGRQEVKAKKPFVGPSGDILWGACPEGDPDTIHGGANDVFVTNAHNCLPVGKKDQNKTAKCVRACSDRLHAEIISAPRKIIIALGNGALWSLTGNYSYKITQERGKIIPSQYAEIGIIPVIHPASLMYGGGSYRQFRSDIQYAFDLARGICKPKAPIIPRFIVHNSPQSAREAIWEIYGEGKPIAADTETTGLNDRTDKIICFGVANTPELVHVFPDYILYAIKDLFDYPELTWIWQNGKFDVKFFWKAGHPGARVDEDLMLASYALDETKGIHDLEQIASDTVGMPDWKYMIQSYLPKKDSSYSLVPRSILYDYMARDVSGLLQAFNVLRPKVAANKGLEKLYTRLLIPASQMLAEVEVNGIYVDKEQLAAMDVKYFAIVEEKKAIVQGIAGYEINPNSNPQIQHFFYDEQKMPRVPRKGRSCDAEVLERWEQTPAVAAMRVYRKAQKMYSTYVKGCQRAIQDDGKVHTSFLIHGTRTGRLSSRGPNMQNQPRLPEIRSQYRASPGRILVELDINQAELRSLATLSGDRELLKIYNDPTSIGLHKELSIQLFGENYTKEEIMRAKAVNFGIVYGREALSLATEFGISLAEAQRWIDGWGERFPEAWDFIQKCRRAPIYGQTLTTCFGRRKRHLLVIKNLLKDFQNEAANFPHQSIASDITLDCAIETAPTLREMNTFIVNLVHDSNILDAPDDPIALQEIHDYTIPAWEAIPPKWGLKKCPFTVEMKTGYRWGHLEEYKGAA